MKPFAFENVVAGDAIGISITGMAIVFCGLMFISLYINYLPSLLRFLDATFGKKQQKVEKTSVKEESSTDNEKDLASVIGLVLQMEEANHQSEQSGDEKDIASVIGMVLQMEHERQFIIPN